MYNRQAGKGLAMITVPCNQFYSQEPKSNGELKAWIKENHDSGILNLAKADVNGDNACDLFEWLKYKSGSGDIKHNFAKFMVYNGGKDVKFWEFKLSPDDILEELKATCGIE